MANLQHIADLHACAANLIPLNSTQSVAQTFKKGNSKMRKLVLGMALATTALATPAMARDDSWYVELDVGAMKAEDTIFDIGTT
ncbi:MAG: hypothetical protein ABL912_11480, partial [Novosphingobium sp.]